MSSEQKVALVTGSGKKRVGWHVAQALAKKGYRLVIHYFTSAQEAEESARTFRRLGVEVLPWQADLTDERAVAAMIEGTLETFGRLDVLVHTAGAWSRKPLEEISAGDVRHFLEVNTLATFLCCQKAGLAMVRQPDGGNIITMGDWAITRPYIDYAAYFPSKGAIPALTRSLAVELGLRNPKVRVNCILPGPVMLPADLPSAEREQAIRSTLVRQEGSPENIAQTVLFFLENDFATGVCVPIDGGRTIFAPDAAM